ncbi:ATP-dependent DNA helicase PIF1-like protein, partial [Tanacetum coccineum]
MAANDQNALPEGNLPPAVKTARPPSELYLDELTQGLTGTINVMICRTFPGMPPHALKLKKELPIMLLRNVNPSQEVVFAIVCGFVPESFQLIVLAKIILTDIQIFDRYVTNSGKVAQLSEKWVLRRLISLWQWQGGVVVGCLGDALIVRMKDVGKKPTDLGPESRPLSNAKSRLMASGHVRDGTSHRAGERNSKKGYRLELDVSDRTASMVVVMFDEPAIELVKCTTDTLASAEEDVGFGYAHDAGLPQALANIVGTIQTMEIKTQSYYEHGNFESFTCWKLAAEEIVAEDVGSTNTPPSLDENIKKSRRVLIKPGVDTPSKPTEERGKKRVEALVRFSNEEKKEVHCGWQLHLNLSVDLNNSDVETTYDMDGDQLDVESKSSSATGKKRGKQANLSYQMILLSRNLKLLCAAGQLPVRQQRRASANMPKRAALTSAGPRYMMQSYQDAMALCRAYRNPDLFITSNPKWPEIAEILTFIPGQKPYERPKIVVYVIEFQKRGLSPAHILLWLEEEWKCETPSEVDDMISAELPSPTIDHRRDTIRIASLLLPGGRTAHSRFVIPLELVENSTCGIKQNTHLAELLQQVELIIWDEAPMTQKYAFEALDRTLRDILGYKNPCKRSVIFGGVTVLLGGDFRQILPLYWQVFILTRSMRVNEYSANGEVDYRKKEFNKWILDVGDGTVEAKKKKMKTNPPGLKFQKIFLSMLPNLPSSKSLKKHTLISKTGGTTAADEVCKGSTRLLEQPHLFPTEFFEYVNFPGNATSCTQTKEETPNNVITECKPKS